MSHFNIVSKFYKKAIVCGIIIGAVNGLKIGYDSALSTCFKKDNMTNIEYITEYGCFGLIILSSSMATGLLSGVIVATSPISVPIWYSQFYTQCKDTR